MSTTPFEQALERLSEMARDEHGFKAEMTRLLIRGDGMSDEMPCYICARGDCARHWTGRYAVDRYISPLEAVTDRQLSWDGHGWENGFWREIERGERLRKRKAAETP